MSFQDADARFSLRQLSLITLQFLVRLISYGAITGYLMASMHHQPVLGQITEDAYLNVFKPLAETRF